MITGIKLHVRQSDLRLLFKRQGVSWQESGGVEVNISGNYVVAEKIIPGVNTVIIFKIFVHPHDLLNSSHLPYCINHGAGLFSLQVNLRSIYRMSKKLRIVLSPIPDVVIKGFVKLPHNAFDDRLVISPFRLSEIEPTAKIRISLLEWEPIGLISEYALEFKKRER